MENQISGDRCTWLFKLRWFYVTTYTNSHFWIILSSLSVLSVHLIILFIYNYMFVYLFCF